MTDQEQERETLTEAITDLCLTLFSPQHSAYDAIKLTERIRADAARCLAQHHCCASTPTLLG